MSNNSNNSASSPTTSYSGSSSSTPSTASTTITTPPITPPGSNHTDSTGTTPSLSEFPAPPTGIPMPATIARSTGRPLHRGSLPADGNPPQVPQSMKRSKSD